jgi:hypothetical protein
MCRSDLLYWATDECRARMGHCERRASGFVEVLTCKNLEACLTKSLRQTASAAE